MKTTDHLGETGNHYTSNCYDGACKDSADFSPTEREPIDTPDVNHNKYAKSGYRSSASPSHPYVTPSLDFIDTPKSTGFGFIIQEQDERKAECCTSAVICLSTLFLVLNIVNPVIHYFLINRPLKLEIGSVSFILSAINFANYFILYVITVMGLSSRNIGVLESMAKFLCAVDFCFAMLWMIIVVVFWVLNLRQQEATGTTYITLASSIGNFVHYFIIYIMLVILVRALQ